MAVLAAPSVAGYLLLISASERSRQHGSQLSGAQSHSSSPQSLTMRKAQRIPRALSAQVLVE